MNSLFNCPFGLCPIHPSQPRAGPSFSCNIWSSWSYSRKSECTYGCVRLAQREGQHRLGCWRRPHSCRGGRSRRGVGISPKCLLFVQFDRGRWMRASPLGFRGQGKLQNENEGKQKIIGIEDLPKSSGLITRASETFSIVAVITPFKAEAFETWTTFFFPPSKPTYTATWA